MLVNTISYTEQEVGAGWALTKQSVTVQYRASGTGPVL